MIRMLCADVSLADERVYDRLYRAASAQRRRRADRYLRGDDKLRCVTAEALLRTALGTADFCIGHGAHGKPYVIDRADFHYNLSHSGRYVVLAWGESEVGVDVQQHDPAVDIPSVAQRCFAPDELDYLACDATQRLRRFYEIWTAKESYLKYTGEGIRKDMRTCNTRGGRLPVRHLHVLPHEDHSLCLCATDSEYMFDLPDVRQLW